MPRDLTPETREVVTKLRGDKDALDRLFSSRTGERVAVSYSIGEAISRLCLLDARLQDALKALDEAKVPPPQKGLSTSELTKLRARGRRAQRSPHTPR